MLCIEKRVELHILPKGEIDRFRDGLGLSRRS